MIKENPFKIEYVIYLFPFTIFTPNLFYDHILLSKIRLEHILLLIIFFFMIINFIKAPWLPKLMILLTGIWLSFHLLFNLMLTDFSAGNIRYIKLLGYIESYLSFILIIFFIDYYCVKHPNKIKQTLNRLIKNFILSSFVTLSLIIIILLNYKNDNFYFLNLFSSDTGMYTRAYNVGRYLGPIAMPIEAGFYSAFGMLIVLYAYKFKVLSSKSLIIFSFLAFNLIGIASGSKVYVLGLIIFLIATLAMYFITREKLYRSIFSLITLSQIIIVSFTTLIISPLIYDQKLYILKYYDLNNYNNIYKITNVVSGGRIVLKKQEQINDDFKMILKKYSKEQFVIDNEQNLKKLIDDMSVFTTLEKKDLFLMLNQNKVSFNQKYIRDFMKKKSDQLSYDEIETLKIINIKSLSRFEYQGAFDSQHKMIKSHGGNISLMLLLFLYILLCISAIKIYFANKVLGVFFISLTLLMILTSTGFPIFFSNVMFFFNCIVICSLLMITSDKIKFWT